MLECKNLEEAKIHIQALYERDTQVHSPELRLWLKRLDTLASPLWKRIWFRINGWGPWYIVNEKPNWRPWHKWIKP